MKTRLLLGAATVGLACMLAVPDADAHGRGHRGYRSGPSWSVDFHWTARPWHGYYSHYPRPYYGYYGPWVAPIVVAPIVGGAVVAETPVIETPPTYIERSDVPPASAENWWYWCGEAGKYYPYVQNCPGGWQRVPPQPVR